MVNPHNNDKDIRIYQKDNILENKNNIKGKISMILLNIPDGVSDLAKVRYIYKMLGNMFCYDYGIIANESIAGATVNYENIDRFQTCGQIAEILAAALSGINGGVKTGVITRSGINTSEHTYEHKATSVEFKDKKTDFEYKLLLDLTLDLYRIQSGMQTKQFGFTTDALGTYDIISLKECEDLDKELGLLEEEGYLDKKIEKVKDEISKLDGFKTIEKLRYMWSKLNKSFAGPHEARQYFENVLRECFPTLRFKIFNMYYEDVSKTDFESLFVIKDEEEKSDDIFLLVDNRSGVLRSDKDTITNMLRLGWVTTSNSINDVLGYDPYDMVSMKL